MQFLILILGLVLIAFAADMFILAAAKMSSYAKISPMVVGLTLVAFGTSAPEIGVAIASAYYGNTAIALGNVLGSNVANIALVLGLCALIAPIKVNNSLINQELPIVLLVTFLLVLLLIDYHLDILDGLIFTLALIGFFYWLIKRHQVPSSDDLMVSNIGLGLALIYLLIGIVLLPLSSHMIVTSATQIAKALGVSDLIIGVTLVAIGTSLPEIVTAIAAAWRNHHDMLIGNILGSNIFNVLAVLPFPAIIHPSALESDIRRDLIMVVLTIMALYFIVRGNKNGSIKRWHGGALLLSYCFYLMYLVTI